MFEPVFRSSRVVLFVVVAFAGIGLGVFLLVYLPKGYSRWRESILLRRATTLLQQQKYPEANRAAYEALRIDPKSLSAFYILAESTEQENRAETVTWRAQIANLLPHDLDSQLNLASAALRFGQLDLARKAMENVAPDDRDKAAYHIVAGWLANAQGNEAEVEEQFRAAVEKEPNNNLYQFNLAVIQIRSSDLEKSNAARAALERLSKQTAFRTGSLRALLSDAIRRNNLPVADDLAQQLQMSPEVTFADYLLCLDFYQKLNEKKFDAVLERVKPVAERSPGNLALLMDWMNQHGLVAQTLKWMEKLKPNETTQPPPAVAIAEAFATVKNWSRLKRWTRNSDWGDADYLRFAYQAYAARQMRAAASDAEFDSLWNSAQRAATNSPERQLRLARLATKWNLNTEAEQLWLQVSKYPPNRREALDALQKIYRARNDLPNLYQIAQRLHESSPNEVGAATNYARLSLLTEYNTPEGHRLAKEAYDDSPNDLNCAVTYAFSLYGLGRTAEGIEILSKFPPEQLHAPHVAVYLAVLLLDENQSTAAKEYIDDAQRGPIFPEEKELLEEARTKVSSPPPVPSASPGFSHLEQDGSLRFGHFRSGNNWELTA